MRTTANVFRIAAILFGCWVTIHICGALLFVDDFSTTVTVHEKSVHVGRDVWVTLGIWLLVLILQGTRRNSDVRRVVGSSLLALTLASALVAVMLWYPAAAMSGELPLASDCAGGVWCPLAAAMIIEAGLLAVIGGLALLRYRRRGFQH